MTEAERQMQEALTGALMGDGPATEPLAQLPVGQALVESVVLAGPAQAQMQAVLNEVLGQVAAPVERGWRQEAVQVAQAQDQERLLEQMLRQPVTLNPSLIKSMMS